MSTFRWASHAIILGLAGVLANISLTIALLVKPFNEGICWKIACWTATTLWGYMQAHFEDTLNAGPVLTFSGDINLIQADEGAVVIANHQGYADYYLIHALASRTPSRPSSISNNLSNGHSNGISEKSGGLQSKQSSPASSETVVPKTKERSKEWGMLGKCRYFAKRSLVWQVPVFGWSMWAVGMILVARNWTSDGKLIAQAFSRIKTHHHQSWIISYLEGTRWSPKKQLQSQAFCRKNGKVELERVLYPRVKGFVCTVQELRGSHIKYLYDLTFNYTSPSKTNPGRVPSLSEILGTKDLAKAGYKFHVDVKRVLLEDLPEDEEGLKLWVEEAWIKKDALLRGVKILDGWKEEPLLVSTN